jgi:hypothetical protein
MAREGSCGQGLDVDPHPDASHDYKTVAKTY